MPSFFASKDSASAPRGHASHRNYLRRADSGRRQSLLLRVTTWLQAFPFSLREKVARRVG